MTLSCFQGGGAVAAAAPLLESRLPQPVPGRCLPPDARADPETSLGGAGGSPRRRAARQKEPTTHVLVIGPGGHDGG